MYQKMNSLTIHIYSNKDVAVISGTRADIGLRHTEGGVVAGKYDTVSQTWETVEALNSFELITQKLEESAVITIAYTELPKDLVIAYQQSTASGNVAITPLVVPNGSALKLYKMEIYKRKEE